MINKVKKIVNISYSKLFDLPLPWNTVELYEAAVLEESMQPVYWIIVWSMAYGLI